MPLDHTMLSANERMLLERELMQLAQANQPPFPRTTGFFPAASAAAASLPPLPNNSSTAEMFLGLGTNNFSGSLLPPLPPPVVPSTNSSSNSSALDAAAAMLLARSRQATAAGRNSIAAALGLNYGGFGAAAWMPTMTAPSFTTNTTAGSAAARTQRPGGLETLQLECLRAERELSERRRQLERQLGGGRAAQQASVAAAPPQQPTPPPQQQPPADDLEKLLLLQNAACIAKKEPEEGGASNNSSSGASNYQESSSSSIQPHASSYSPNRKRYAEPPHSKTKNKEKKPPKKKKQPPLEPPGQKNRSKWNSYFEALRAYKQEYGDCCVPRGFSDNPKLASWVAEQRKQYKLYTCGKPNSITPERIEMLEGLDFAWRQQEVAWERHKEQLAEYFAEYGHCSVPLNHPRYPGLGNWIKQQRRLYKRRQKGMADNQLPEDRIQALSELGFDWNSTNKRNAKSSSNVNGKSGSSSGKKKSRASGNKRQKPMVSTSLLSGNYRRQKKPHKVSMTATTTMTTTTKQQQQHRAAVERSDSNESLPLKKRRRIIKAVEV